MFQMLRPQVRIPPPKGSDDEPCDLTYYELLKVEPIADMTQLKKAFRKIALKHHPDKGGNREKFQEFNHAYEILSNQELRSCYNAYGPDFEKVQGIEFFKKQLKSPSADIKLNIPLKGMMQGTDMTIHFQRRVGPNGRSYENVTETIRVPSGAPDGFVITQNGQGHHLQGKLPGDLRIILQTTCPEGWKRKADCLIHFCPVNVIDMLLKRPLTIQHPNGETLYLETREPWAPEKWYKIDGKGVTNQGDLFVTINPSLPKLTPTELQNLGQLFPQNSSISEDQMITVESVSQDHLATAFQTSADQSEMYDQMHESGPGDCHMQ